ncbi:hypothetical protein AR158_c201L [Paramecium bursaria Chlorella virus AR158]|uniref:hypothetical protein n=1 Tax=Paramecium bursaria Chlorella virus AR158 TaxID=380598 RepID=UPI00015AA857|nr:hypothetical protein AR158_c201L [Paramecium bursaria Chlorella virus AR158]ABU43747.1 hypothetical protein AR158_c201L [Paramecium bursaria Chlorella virus AR158]
MWNLSRNDFSPHRTLDLDTVSIVGYPVGRRGEPRILIMNEKTEFEHSTTYQLHCMFCSFCFVFHAMF